MTLLSLVTWRLFLTYKLQFVLLWVQPHLLLPLKADSKTRSWSWGVYTGGSHRSVESREREKKGRKTVKYVLMSCLLPRTVSLKDKEVGTFIRRLLCSMAWGLHWGRPLHISGLHLHVAKPSSPALEKAVQKTVVEYWERCMELSTIQVLKLGALRVGNGPLRVSSTDDKKSYLRIMAKLMK